MSDGFADQLLPTQEGRDLRSFLRSSADWLGRERAVPAGRWNPGRAGAGAGRSLGSGVMGARPGREPGAQESRRGAARFPGAWSASRIGDAEQ